MELTIDFPLQACSNLVSTTLRSAICYLGGDTLAGWVGTSCTQWVWVCRIWILFEDRHGSIKINQLFFQTSEHGESWYREWRLRPHLVDFLQWCILKLVHLLAVKRWEQWGWCVDYRTAVRVGMPCLFYVDLSWSHGFKLIWNLHGCDSWRVW